MDDQAVETVMAGIRALFCHDFDGTFIQGNSQVAILKYLGLAHIPLEELLDNLPLIMAAFHEKKEECWEVLKKMAVLGNRETWKEAIETVARDGHFQVIVSFNIFGKELFPRFLKEIIGLEEDFIQQHIAIVSFWPEEGEKADKSEHLERAKIYAKEKLGLAHIPNFLVVFTDDNWKNYINACAMKYKGIHAKPSGIHVQQIIEHSKSIKKPVIKRKENDPNSSSDDTRSLVNSMEELWKSGSSRSALGCSRESADSEERELIRSGSPHVN